ncbi:MAG: DUF1080 domain-containing protein [Acidobacteria bacterium]|nr:DUF1080 domain-containing protein [Acidobacteriota bacterium]
MRKLVFLALLLGAAAPGARPDAAFNGRWDITVDDSDRKRVWWLEITGAGTPQLAGRFVGAPGGGMYPTPELAIRDGELRFVFKGRYRQARANPGQQWTGTYRARLQGGKLVGTLEIEGAGKAIHWAGTRAPEIPDHDDGRWIETKPVELFNGEDLSGWQYLHEGKQNTWSVADGLLRNQPAASDIASGRKFWNFKLHVEFRVFPKSNSGLGLRGRYEVQIIDDYGRPPTHQGNGALYYRLKPSQNASKPAGEWQSFDITLIGRDLTVVLNGAKIIDKQEVEGFTAMATDANEGQLGPLTIQGDHGTVEFRKITMTPLRRK